MKWIVYYFRFYAVGKGDPAGDSSVVGYSNKSEQELFETLERVYPKLPVRKKVFRYNEYGYKTCDAFDKSGKKDDNFLFKDYIYFTENNLKEF